MASLQGPNVWRRNVSTGNITAEAEEVSEDDAVLTWRCPNCFDEVSITGKLVLLDEKPRAIRVSDMRCKQCGYEVALRDTNYEIMRAVPA